MDDFFKDNNIKNIMNLKQLSQKDSEIEKEQDVKKLCEHEQQAFERKYKLEKTFNRFRNR